MESYLLENSLSKPAPFIKENEEIIKENKTINIKFKNKTYPLKISLTSNNIIFTTQEKYNLYHYKNIFSFQAFQNLHKYFRFFDNLNEIYNDLIKSNINIKEENINQGTLILLLNININNNNYEINITLNKKELDKYKDIDIIMSNYIEMKKELDELKQKFGINNDENNENNLFKGSVIFKNNIKYINLIREGVRHQLNKEIINTKLLYRCSKDGDDCGIFHQKCDGIPNTLVIGESTSNKIFGGFTSQKWDKKSGTKNDDNAFIFQLNQMKIYYVIKGKGGIYCEGDFGPTFGNDYNLSLCFQDDGMESLDNGNREDPYNEKNNSFTKNSTQNYILEGNRNFTLKDYEVFELNLN